MVPQREKKRCDLDQNTGIMWEEEFHITDTKM